MFELTGAPASFAALEAMTGIIRHRGPDHSAVFTDHEVGLGYVRLSIIDTSEAGNQPMKDASGQFVCVYNGEVYNFAALRQELESEGVRFRSKSDTEVVVNLFAHHGVSGIKKLNGIFGLAIWSKLDRELWLIRDPIGVKPLYYLLDGNRLTFASELKAILASTDGIPAIDTEGLLNYLTYGHAIAPVTMLQGMRKLMPGQYLRAKGGDVSFGRYFDFPVPSGHREPNRPVHEWAEEATDVLRASVRRQMIADVPVGVFLSGGIDSSLITALMAQQSSAVETFSITFPQNGSYDESQAARLVAKRLGTRHHEVAVGESDLVNALDDLVYQYDEPFADAAGLPLYLLSRFARTRVKVALSGEGGDEMFGGYRRYLAERAASAYTGLPSVLRYVGRRAAAHFGRARIINRLASTLAIDDPADRYAGWVRTFSREALELLLTADLRQSLNEFNGTRIYRDLFARCGGCGVLSRLFFADAQTWLPDTYLEKVDKASMAHSLEVRVPMLDLEVVRLAARLPDWLRIRRFTTKYLLRHVAKPLLPASIIRRPKHGLALPTDPWFRGKLKEYVRDVLLGPGALSRSFFSSRAVETLLERHSQLKENCESRIWNLLILELWMRRIGRVGRASPALALSLT
jgi:asparagine synthase (glutamine-hydrolysing)